MYVRTRRAVVALLAAAGCLCPAGCEKPPAPAADAAAPAPVELVVLSPHGPAIRDAFAHAFSVSYEKQYGQIVSLRWIQKGTLECLRDITGGAEGLSGLPAHPDVFFGGGVAVHREVASRGLARSIELPEDLLAALPAELNGQPLRGADGSWFGSALSGFGILYNRAACETRGVPAPVTWADLAGPAYEGWVAAADPAASGSTMQCLMLILLSQGWEDGWGIVMGILANCNGLSPSSSHIAPNVATGLAVAGLEPEFVARMAIANHPDALDYASPPSATAITPDPIMVLRQARNVETAGRFVVFVLSPEGQRLWALSPDAGGPLSGPLYRYPVRPDTYKEYEGKLTVKVNPFEAQAGFQIDPDAEAAYTKLLPHLFTAACGKNHLLLQQAWRTARQRGEDWPGWAELRRPLLTREEAVAAAVECGESSQRARELEAEWSEAFRRRYQAAIATTAAAAR